MTESQFNTKKKKVNKIENLVNELEPIIVDADRQEIKDNELYLFSCGVLSFENIFVSSTKRNIDTLVVIGQSGVTSLNGISGLGNLRELWFVESLLTDISDLEECKKIEKLYLYSNNISRVPNMSKSPELKLLSLSGNKVLRLENFESMPKLRELYMAKNKIQRIGNSLANNSHLSLINLAGNNLYELKDIKNLEILKNLREIIMADSMYGECPIVSLCNYRYFVINNLSSLIELDHYAITSEERSYATEFFESKMMFYEMLSNKHRDQFTKSLRDHLEENRQRISQYRKYIYSTKLEQLRISRSNNVDLRYAEILKHLNNLVDVNEASEKQWLENAETNFQILQRQFSIKAQHWGNINFVDYAATDDAENTIVKICEEICNDSLCRSMKKDFGITSVYVHRVTKVINNETNAFRFAKYFNESENQDDKGSDSVFKFLVKPVGVCSLENWPFEIFEEEFFYTTEIITTDCLAAADADWMREIFLQQKSSVPFASLSNEHRIAILVQLPISAITKTVEKLDSYHAMRLNSDEYGCPCFSVFNAELVKPVFVVEFQYVTQKESGEDVSGKKNPSIESASANSSNTWPRLNMGNLERCMKLTESDILKLQIIDISGSGISAIDLTTPLPNLRELNLSYNKLTVLPNPAILKYVKKLDVSLNDIRYLEITTCLPLLESFNFAWNLAGRFFSVLKTLKNFMPNLTALNTKHNPFVDVTRIKSMQLLAQNALPSLKCFNDNIIENFANSKPLSSLGNERNGIEFINLSTNYLIHFEIMTEFDQLRTLHLANNLLVEFSLKKPVDQLTKLNLSGNFIKTVDGLRQENLPVINYLDLSNNLITSLVEMGSFNSLTQFYCSHNEISKLQDIYNLKNWQGLKIIDISNNPIDSIGFSSKFLIFHIPKIEYVGGQCVTPSEISEANHIFGGSLDKDTIRNMSNMGEFTYLKQLSIVDCAIKKVNLTADFLPNLESLDLSKNLITTLWGLHNLKKLQVLCLSNNQVATATPICREDLSSAECSFPNLYTLILDYNRIKTLVDLNLKNMPELKYLYLQNNELQDLDGLQKCVHLETLVLDNNKIQIITEESFHKDNNIKALFLENNKIKFLYFVKRLPKINKLFISNNKLADKEQLKYLGNVEQLKEITILGNPLCKRTNHYKYAIRVLDSLTHIDGHSVTPEEDLNDSL